nr:PIN domain-containing protein [Pseudomonas oleovorans]
MKNKFPGHFSNAATNSELWKTCLFVFDANILLNLYRYSDETRNLFIQTLKTLQKRIWIPYRVAYEYLENRLNVIHEQQEEYEKSITEINNIKEKLENTRKHPFVSESTMKGVTASLEKAIDELRKNKEIHSNRINNDEIKDFISELFKDRVGDAPSNETLEEIITEGSERYKQKTPPGYSDLRKQSAEESLAARCRPFGDLIIWKDILNKAKQDKTSIIFITDDGKEDWWLRFKGKTLGPRPELIDEFKKETTYDFHMYLPERFLSYSNIDHKNKPSQEVLEEIIDTRKKEENTYIKPEDFTYRFSDTLTKKHNIFTNEQEKEIEDEDLAARQLYEKFRIMSELNEISRRTTQLIEKKDALTKARDTFFREYDSPNPMDENPRLLELSTELELTEHDLNFLLQQRHKLIRKMQRLKSS